MIDLSNSAGVRPPVRVLLVDDDQALRDGVRSYLEQHGYLVIAAPGAPEALSAVFSGAVDIVLSDVHMPGMDGLELLQWIRSSQASSGIPVILVSADTERDTLLEAVKLGATDYLYKPATLDQLLDAVRRALPAPLRPSPAASEGVAVPNAAECSGLRREI
jgi:CheY-like chemotaxis protein